MKEAISSTEAVGMMNPKEVALVLTAPVQLFQTLFGLGVAVMMRLCPLMYMFCGHPALAAGTALRVPFPEAVTNCSRKHGLIAALCVIAAAGMLICKTDELLA
jgi:hypothetical protein